MTRIVGKEILVETQHGIPRAFLFRGQHVVMDVLDRWVETGDWWRGQADREMFRVLTRDGGVFELERSIDSDAWRLYKVWD